MSPAYITREDLASRGAMLMPQFLLETDVSYTAAYFFFSLLFFPGHAGAEGRCRIRWEILSGMAGTTVEFTQRHIGELVNAGLLEPVPDTCEYWFVRQEWMQRLPAGRVEGE